jgi:transposase InsO family protein
MNWTGLQCGYAKSRAVLSHLADDRWRVFCSSRRPRAGGDFATRAAGLGIGSIRTPVQSPRAIGERVVRSLRQECLDHILPLSERHVRLVLAEFVSYYNQDRRHRSFGLETPVPSRRQVDGKVISRPVLGGLHHVYARAA